MIHQWIYTMVPVMGGKVPSNAGPIYFLAYCKGCGTYFSEPIPIGADGLFSRSSLPREGCEGNRAPNLGDVES